MLPTAGPAQSAQGAVILSASIEPLRIIDIHRPGVKLADRHIVEMAEAGRTVLRDIKSTVISDPHLLRIIRIHPDRMMIHVHIVPHRTPTAAPVSGFVHGHSQHIDGVFITGIDVNITEIPAKRTVKIAQRPIIDLAPTAAPVGGFEYPSEIPWMIGVDSIEHLRIAGRNA